MMKWRYNERLYHWEATTDAWRAVVQRLSDASGWHPYLERIHPPHDRRDGPTSAWALEGRVWCEGEIKRQRLQLDQ
jgi:hypothetical protein